MATSSPDVIFAPANIDGPHSVLSLTDLLTEGEEHLLSTHSNELLTEIDVPKRAASDLPPKAVFISNTQLHDFVLKVAWE